MLEKYKQNFTETRFNELCDIVKEKGMRISHRDFTCSEIDFIIDETPLSDLKKKGAKMYYIKQEKENAIADKLCYSYSQIKYYKKAISKALRETCCRIFK